jgi:hypothetical protein
MLTLWSATRAVHARALPPFASTDTRIAPGPLPLAPETTWTQASSTAAVHVQPTSVSTLSVTVPPPAGTVEFAGETTNLHGAGSCETAIWVPLTSSMPRRDAGCPFASTR